MDTGNTNKRFLCCDSLGSQDWDSVYIFEDEEDMKKFVETKHILHDNDILCRPGIIDSYYKSDEPEYDYTGIFIPKGSIVPEFNKPLFSADTKCSFVCSFKINDKGEFKNEHYYLTSFGESTSDKFEYNPKSGCISLEQTLQIDIRKGYWTDYIWISANDSKVMGKYSNANLFREYEPEYFKSKFGLLPQFIIAKECKSTMNWMMGKYEQDILKMNTEIFEKINKANELYTSLMTKLHIG